ncbi:MAG TPA: GAF domain-containing protein, partial [Vicinamibacterales bacterium]|nr:GAF domain-containing protein [Vicinamibacterales bacterium]
MQHTGMPQNDRDYWHTLLDVTNDVVTKRDLASLRAAIAPNVRRVVPHDHTNLYLIDDKRQLQSFVIDPTALPWPEDLADSIRLDVEPYKSWLSRTTAIDVDTANRTGWEVLHAHVEASGVKWICTAPLMAPHRLVGVLSLGRLTPTPFTQDELQRVTQVASQIAIALENAMAFEEIA